MVKQADGDAQTRSAGDPGEGWGCARKAAWGSWTSTWTWMLRDERGREKAGLKGALRACLEASEQRWAGARAGGVHGGLQGGKAKKETRTIMRVLSTDLGVSRHRIQISTLPLGL